MNLIYPDLAVASLNNGVDACAGSGANSNWEGIMVQGSRVAKDWQVMMCGVCGCLHSLPGLKSMLR